MVSATAWPGKITTAQGRQFLGAAVGTYWPDQTPVWQSAAAEHG